MWIKIRANHAINLDNVTDINFDIKLHEKSASIRLSLVGGNCEITNDIYYIYQEGSQYNLEDYVKHRVLIENAISAKG